MLYIFISEFYCEASLMLLNNVLAEYFVTGRKKKNNFDCKIKKNDYDHYQDILNSLVVRIESKACL